MIVLKKQPDKDFVILNLTDPQLSDQEWVGKEAYARNVLKKTVRELVGRVKPDLITVTGDIAWAGNFTAHTMVADFLESFQIPWAPVWGNHDQQDGMKYIEEVVAAYQQRPHCVYESGDPALGNGNYVIGIAERENLLTGLIMMDSHDRCPYCNEEGVESNEWAKLYPEQIDWYQQQVEALQQIGCTKTAVMMHIPIHAYRLAHQEWIAAPETKKVTLGDNLENYIYTAPQGDCYEGICSYPADEGMFDRIRSLGSTKVVVAGHDHVNNVVWDYKGVKLVYSLKTGPGCYWNPKLNGGTVLTVGSDGDISVRHEFVEV